MSRTTPPNVCPTPGSNAVLDAECQRLQRYLEALEQAGSAIDIARKLRPQQGLDHAIDRLRWLLLDGSRELQALLEQREN